MQKIITYCFILFYFLLSIGVTADIHFCDGEIHSVSLAKMPTKSCCGAKEKNCGCCKDINLVFKKSGDEKITYTDKIQFNSVVIVSTPLIAFKLSKSLITKEVEKQKHFFPPPNSSYSSINIRNCTFLI